MKKEELRPVDITSHHFYMRGWFHGVAGYSIISGEDVIQYTHYLIEDEFGDLHKFSIERYSIKFTDRKVQKSSNELDNLISP